MSSSAGEGGSRSPAGPRRPPRHRAGARSSPDPGARLVRVGALVFLLGLAAVVGVVVPFFLGGHRNSPLGLNLAAALLLPLGLGLALLGVYRAARSAPAVDDEPGTGPAPGR